MNPWDALLNLPRFGTGIGLHRMQVMLKKLERSFKPIRTINPLIKVTGSNGKGSVVALSSAILKALEVPHVTFTSPHMEKVSDRVRLMDAKLRQGTFEDLCLLVLKEVQALEEKHPGQQVASFEALTALAYATLHASDAETMVVEAGIGGRYDSTRVLPNGPTALVSVDMEHHQLLGNSPELIAYDKADLCAPGETLVLGHLHEDLRERLDCYNRLRQVIPHWIDQRFEWRQTSCKLEGQRGMLRWQGELEAELLLTQPSAHAVNNAMIAIELVWCWLKSSGKKIPVSEYFAQAVGALAEVKVEGLFEWIGNRPPILLDVAHTPRALSHLAETVKQLNQSRPVICVFGLSEDKSAQTHWVPIKDALHTTVVTTPPLRGLCAEALHEQILQCAPDQLPVCRTQPESALDWAIHQANSINGMVLVCGSFYLVRQLRESMMRKQTAV